MKALHYGGPFKTFVKEIPVPKLEHPDDVLVKVTTSAICGSDLHMYQGRTAAESGLVFGHEVRASDDTMQLPHPVFLGKVDIHFIRRT